MKKLNLRFKDKYVCDFETTPKSQYLKEKHVRVWYGYLENIYDENENFEFINIIDWFEWFVNKNKNVLMYFHNLTFDGEFIHWLGYWSEKYNFIMVNNYEDIINNSMYVFRDEKYTIYEIIICYNNKYLKLLCSLRLIPISVNKLAKDMNMTLKKEFKFNHKKERNYNNINEININDKNYCINDVKVVIKILKEFFLICKNIKMTIASTSFSNFRQTLGKNYNDLLENKITPEQNKYLSNWYSGGYTWNNKENKDNIIENINVYDINSLYPYVMQKFKMPIEEPIECNNKCEHDRKLHYIIISKAKLKKEYHPFIKEKNSFRSINYLEEVENRMMYFTNIELSLITKYYNIEYNINHTICFKSTNGIFDKYINYWYNMRIKYPKPHPINIIAKLMLNSLYGKMGSKIKRINKIFEEGKDGEYLNYRLINNESESEYSYYIPIAIFVTSIARSIIITAQQENRKIVKYIDTDSLHCNGIPNININNNELGAFKFEGFFDKAKYNSAKQYFMYNKEKNKKVLKVAGLTMAPDWDVAKMLTSFGKDTIIDGKLNKKRVVGGQFLENIDFNFLNKKDK